MREKGKLQAVLDFSSPSSSAAFTDENASESESPVHVVKTVVPKKKVHITIFTLFVVTVDFLP